MGIVDFLVIAVIAAILIPVLCYIRKSKKKGIQCIGCPDAPKCAGHCAGCPGGCAKQNPS